MAKKSQNLTPLSLTEIILRADVATIRQALEARTQIDSLLQEREAAYQRIAELETQVCAIVGEGGTFPGTVALASTNANTVISISFACTETPSLCIPKRPRQQTIKTMMAPTKLLMLSRTPTSRPTK